MLALFEIQAEEFKSKVKGSQSYPVMHLLVMRLKQKSMQSLSKVNSLLMWQYIKWYYGSFMTISRYSIKTFFKTEQLSSREFPLHLLVFNFQTITKPFTPLGLKSSIICAENQLTAFFKNRRAINWSNVLAVLENPFRQEQMMPLSLWKRSQV